MNRKTYILHFIVVLMIVIAEGIIDDSFIDNDIDPGVIEESFNGATETGIGGGNNQESWSEQNNTNDCIPGPRLDPVLESLAGIHHCNEYGQ